MHLEKLTRMRRRAYNRIGNERYTNALIDFRRLRATITVIVRREKRRLKT